MSERIENIKQLGNLLDELNNKSRANTVQLDLLFTLHNYFNPNHKETGKFCTPCVSRVYTNVKLIFEQIKYELEN